MIDHSSNAESCGGTGDYPGTPRWVKVFGIVVLVLVLGVIRMMALGVGGEHGPGRHRSSERAGGHTGPAVGVLPP
jgi:hypothetical protein